MARHRPKLAALAAMADDEGAIDTRLLGDQVIANLPWPIGIEVRRLLSGSMREPDRRRLDQLFRTFERSVQFLAFVMLAQLWKARKDGRISVPEAFAREFQRRAPMVSLGNLTWMVRQIGRVWKASGQEWVVTQIGALVNDRFCDALDAWVPERNEMGHYHVNLTAEEVQRRCVVANDRLTEVLVALAFLVKYRLVTTYAESDSDADRGAPIGAVSLIRGRSEAQVVLAPLVIEAKVGDIHHGFLFSKFRKGSVFYSGSEATERIDLSQLNGYVGLVEGLQELIGTVGTAH